ncbi:hypothetical protein D3C81_08870 [compost metagenome]
MEDMSISAISKNLMEFDYRNYRVSLHRIRDDVFKLVRMGYKKNEIMGYVRIPEEGSIGDVKKVVRDAFDGKFDVLILRVTGYFVEYVKGSVSYFLLGNPSSEICALCKSNNGELEHITYVKGCFIRGIPVNGIYREIKRIINESK